MHKRTVPTLLLSLLLVGCATTDGYGEFFRLASGVDPTTIAARRANPPPAQPALVRLDGPFDRNVEGHYLREGYMLVAYSTFTSGYRQHDSNAVKAGKLVHPDLVVVRASRFARSITSRVPLTLPSTTTSYTSAAATAYGPGGPAVAFGNSTTTTYGTSTTYMPMTVNRFQYGAFYFVKMKWHLGVICRGLSDQERQALQTNYGCYVTLVVDGTPAYESGILPGDIITAVDGLPVEGYAGLVQVASDYMGQAITLTIARQGKTITKSVVQRR